MNSMHFNQETPYPIRRSPQPPHGHSTFVTSQYDYSGLQTQAPISSTRYVHATSSPVQAAVAEKDKGGRKSILKSWKSPPNSISQATDNSFPSDASGRTSADLRMTVDAAPTARKRRPSIMEFAGPVVRASTGGTPPPDIPPSPLLPEHYAIANATRQSRSQSILENSRYTSARPGHPNGGMVTPPSSFESSRLSSHPSSPSTGTPLANNSPPQLGKGPAISHPSQDDEQFEIIEHVQLQHGKMPSLSYPYHGLDQA